MRLSSPHAAFKISRPGRTVASGGTAAMSVSRYHLQRASQLVIQKGDITKWEGDAVVNAGA